MRYNLQVQAGIFIKLQQHFGSVDQEQLSAVHGGKTYHDGSKNIHKNIQRRCNRSESYRRPEKEHQGMGKTRLYDRW